VTAAPPRAPRPGLVLAVLALTSTNAAFLQTLIIPLQAELPALLGASKDDTAWVLTATLVSAAVIHPIAGRLGDLYGRRRVLLGLLVVLFAGSLLAAVAPTLPAVIVGRAMQGAAIGATPLSIAILRDSYPAARLASAVALVSGTVGIGAAVGLPLGGIVAQLFAWQAVFFFSMALAAVCFALVALVVPPSASRSPGRFDPLGAAGLALGLVGILLAVSKGASWGWLSPLTLGTGIGGAVVLLLWGASQLRRPSPIVDLRLAARRTVLFTNLTTLVLGFGLLGFTVCVPQVLQAPFAAGGLGLTLIGAGLAMLPNGLVMMLAAPLVGRLHGRIGPRALLLLGFSLLTASFGVLALCTELWHFVLVIALFGVGVSFCHGIIPTIVMGAVPVTQTASANGLNALHRSTGTASGAAVIGAVLAATAITVDGAVVPTHVGFLLSCAIGAAAMAAGVVLALLIPRPGRS